MALFARTPLAPLDYSRTLWMRLWVGAVMIFLYAPLVVLMIFSFNDSKRNVVWRGFTTKYYERRWDNDAAGRGAGQLADHRSARDRLASLVIGTFAAVMLWRFRFPFKGAVEERSRCRSSFPKSAWASPS